MQVAIILHDAHQSGRFMNLMGWLRDFMTAAQPPIPSFGKLAGACLDHAEWPDDLRPKERSLATLFSKLDRGKDLDWLRDRVEVQQVLAQLLKRPLGDFRSALGEVKTADSERFVKFIDVRYAREFDLARESLPPGIPREAFEPPEWGPTWWVAPSGSGRTLVRRWLEARGLAHTVEVGSREELQEAPPRGPLFIEVRTDCAEDAFSLTDGDLETLRVTRRPVCIAAPFPPTVPGFEVLQPPKVSEYLPELIDWVDARLDGTGHYDAGRVENWMRKVALPAGAAHTLGDSLGLLGMSDEVHPRSFLGKSLDELGEHFVRRRVREGCEALTSSPRLAEDAYGTLKECAARSLIGGRADLLTAHSVEEWTAVLAPARDSELPDPEWFGQALQGALGSRVSRRDLRRAAKKLPPSSFQLTRALEAAGLLVRDGASESDASARRLHPRWLVSLLNARATQEAVRMSPVQWGQVLLAGHRAREMVHALRDRARRDDLTPFFAVADDFELDEPELVTALEASVIAVGLAELEGRDIPDDLVESLLQCAAEDVLSVGGIPEPRLTTAGAQVFGRAYFLVALAALCLRHPFPKRRLDPMRAESAVLKHAIQDCCHQVLRELPPGAKEAVGILRLMDALFPGNHEDRAPSLRLVDSVRSASKDLLDAALEHVPLETLLAFVRETERSEPLFTRGLWSLLSSEQELKALFSSPEAYRSFWRSAPEHVLVERAHANLQVEWKALLPHQYAALLAQDLPLLGDIAAHVPLDAALARLESRGPGSFSPETLAGVVARGPGRFIPLLLGLLAANSHEEARQLLNSFPPEATESVARALPSVSEILGLRPKTLQVVRGFLLGACRARHPGFERVYNQLAELERRLAPLKNLA